MQRVCYTVRDERKIVCPPVGGFPLERFRDFIQRIMREDPIRVTELKPLVSCLCDDQLISLLSKQERDLVIRCIKPSVNAWLQQQGRRIRAKKAAARAFN